METLQSILVPFDGSPPSIAALDHAVALANDYGAGIAVLQVVPTEDPMNQNARDETERAMNDAFDQAHDQLGDRVVRRTVAGDPLQEIIEIAGEGFDLIVIGTHGRIGRLHELLGSVAEGVIRNAPCPVLTVRDRSANGYQSFSERRHHRPSLGDIAGHERRA